MKKRIETISKFFSLFPLGKLLLIGSGAFLSSSALILNSPVANAQILRFVCDLKTHVKFNDQEVWTNLSNRTWFFAIDYRKNIIKKTWGQNYQWVDNFNIISLDPSHIVAIRENHQTSSGNAKVSSLALNVDTGKITYSDHFTKSGGASFTIHYGVCKKGF